MNLNALTARIDREHDSCGIFARIEKSGVPTRKTVEAGVSALSALRHRAGYVAGEGDGCGLLVDIPRGLWARRLCEAGHPADVCESAYADGFVVGHFYLNRLTADKLKDTICEQLGKYGVDIIDVRFDIGNQVALGPSASRGNPVFVQVAGLLQTGTNDSHLYRASVTLEQVEGVHVVSLSQTTVVYKVVGDSDTLVRYHADLAHEDCTSSFALAHTRYSTNTATASSRVQPFALIGHNGEINTIARFYAEANMLGLWVDSNFSDSQMVDSVIHGITSDKGWSLFETAEMIFPPIVNEVKQMQPALSDMYMFLRALWGPFSQGPAAMIMRKGDEAIFTVDALGLRPLWLVETEDAYSFSSEQGIVPPTLWVANPKALSPGEKVGAKWTADGVRLYMYTELQQVVLERLQQRYRFSGEGRNIRFANAFQAREETAHPFHDQAPFAVRAVAFGWRDDDVKNIEFEIQTSAEPIKSLGYDGPLPALDNGLPSLSDFLQETVAVVTNPAIDREREIEHFSTRVVLGKRPALDGSTHSGERLELQSPLLLESGSEEVGLDELRVIASRHGALCYEDALAALHNGPYGTVEILIHRDKNEDTRSAISRFERRAVEAVNAGANIIVLDDRLQYLRGGGVDPFLTVAAIHKALLRPASSQGGEHLRRRTSLVLRSGSLRNLHDIVVAIGLGADAVDPYLMWELATSKGTPQAVENLYLALCKGLEKVVSTIGIHELRGYERLFGAIGLSTEVASILGVPNFCGNDQVGFGMTQLDEVAAGRQALYDAKDERKLRLQKPFTLYPRIWRAAGQVAEGVTEYGTYFERLDGFEKENPISLRHALSLKVEGATAKPAPYVLSDTERRAVDTTIDGHEYPFVISSMSFGSQGEVAYRAYAEAAYRLNIVGLNGEGGEIKDLMTKYPRNRGRQVASGRFGVNAELANGAYMLEIKIGQGAKPGEGGHLPGSKVTVQVAKARNASPGTDLISPSNNHDIYSIEDLAQVIFELREVNPSAKIAVKVPVVPNIGTIAVGIAKAGADVITLSGFDGGTGAARSHAIRHVGLPVDIGIRLAHDALCESGLRNSVELWADGGMKSAADVMKAILLGANRIGFGTMAMVALGCTSCRACHKDTCHVGIATQMTDKEEAEEKGLTAFEPQEFNLAVDHLTRFFRAVGEHVRALTGALGTARTQDLVGRRDLLQQTALLDKADLGWLLEMRQEFAGMGQHVLYREWPVENEVTAVQGQSGEIRMAVGQGTATFSAANLRVIAGTHGVETTAPMSVDEPLIQLPRALGARVSGEAERQGKPAQRLVLEVPGVGGNGFAAFHQDGMVSVAHGGAQDGVGKSAIGGRIVVLKQRGHDGHWYGGSVGKGLAYGAQRGQFFVQGGADARAGIRLSGADIVIGGELEEQAHDELGWIGERATVKGFAFEYMTAGRAIVLGDPGPWICSGMTGGSVYLRLQPDKGLTELAIRRRVAKGAKVTISSLDNLGKSDIVELLSAYQQELLQSGQNEAAESLADLIAHPTEHFVMVRPGGELTDQSIATE